MSLQARIDAALDAGETDAAEIAERLLDQVPRAEIVALLAREVAHVQRLRALSVERDAFRAVKLAPHPESRPTVTPDERLEPFRKLLSSPFSPGDRTEVTWGEATIAQHQQRIAMLAKLRDGLNRTMDRHREAIRICEEAGVSRLNDVAPRARRKAS